VNLSTVTQSNIITEPKAKDSPSDRRRSFLRELKHMKLGVTLFHPWKHAVRNLFAQTYNETKKMKAFVELKNRENYQMDEG
jgi:hypothetical protein